MNEALELARRATHEFFEANSGWGEPTRDTLEEWIADGVCQCPDECWVAPTGVCEHGLASWLVVLHAMGEHVDLQPATDGQLRNAPNFRDLGGIRRSDGLTVVRGRVFRSGVFDLLDDVDRSVLRAFGLRTVIDLRAADEREARRNRLPADVEEWHRPVTDVSAHPTTIMQRIASGDTEGLGAEMLIRGNRHFVEAQADRFGAVVRELVTPNQQPAVVHCTAGKDRTGFATACLLWVIGVDHDAVVADYLRTNDIMRDRHERTLSEAADRGIDVTKLEEMLVVRRDYLDAAYERAVEIHGSVDAFVARGLGFDDAERDAAASTMLT
jgi:protein-tyrosine phosphatase